MHPAMILATMGSRHYGFSLPSSDRNFVGVYRPPWPPLSAADRCIPVLSVTSDNGASGSQRHVTKLFSPVGWLDACAAGAQESMELAFAQPPLLQHADTLGAQLAAWVRANLVTLAAAQGAIARVAAAITALGSAVAYDNPRDPAAPATRLQAAHAYRVARFYTRLVDDGTCDPRMDYHTTDDCLRMRRWRRDYLDTVSLLQSAHDALAAAVSVNRRGIPAAPDPAAMEAELSWVHAHLGDPL